MRLVCGMNNLQKLFIFPLKLSFFTTLITTLNILSISILLLIATDFTLLRRSVILLLGQNA
jgi:hypothetical protein